MRTVYTPRAYLCYNGNLIISSSRSNYTRGYTPRRPCRILCVYCTVKCVCWWTNGVYEDYDDLRFVAAVSPDTRGQTTIAIVYKFLKVARTPQSRSMASITIAHAVRMNKRSYFPSTHFLSTVSSAGHSRWLQQISPKYPSCYTKKINVSKTYYTSMAEYHVHLTALHGLIISNYFAKTLRETSLNCYNK